jgi:hypothetical protein
LLGEHSRIAVDACATNLAWRLENEGLLLRTEYLQLVCDDSNVRSETGKGYKLPILYNFLRRHERREVQAGTVNTKELSGKVFRDFLILYSS